MTLRTLLKKELLWLRRNRWAVLLVFLLLPALFTVSTTAFEQAFPRDVPVAVTPASDATTSDELRAIDGVAGTFSQPQIVESESAATAALKQERVYGVLTAPHGLYDENQSVNVTYTVSGAIVPYDRPSLVIAEHIRDLVAGFPASVTVDRVSLAPQRTLSEYLLVSGVPILLLVYAFTYVPYHLGREHRAFDRLRVESTLRTVLASKALLFLGLLGLVLGTVVAVATALGYRTALLHPAALATVVLTFVSLTAVSLGITFFTRFSVTGRFLNVVLLVGAVMFSNLIYPRGFFSTVRGSVAHWIPLHHAAVVLRGIALAGRPTALFADRILILAGVTAASLAWLAAAVVYYERGV